MKPILVGIKRVVDYNVRIRVKPDASGVITEGVKMSVNPFDEIALEEALRIKERGAAEEVIVATVGPADCQQQLRTGPCACRRTGPSSRRWRPARCYNSSSASSLSTTGASAPVEKTAVSAEIPSHTRFVSVSAAKSDRPDLQIARGWSPWTPAMPSTSCRSATGRQRLASDVVPGIGPPLWRQGYGSARCRSLSRPSRARPRSRIRRRKFRARFC